MSNIILQAAIVMLLAGSVFNMTLYAKNVIVSKKMEQDYKQDRKLVIKSHLKRFYRVAA